MSALEDPTEPLCFNECTVFLKGIALNAGTEVNVMVCPDPYVFLVPGYQPFVTVCPHGVRWIVEPTGEQIAEWVRTETP